jgi:hypothetical protein
MAPLQGDERQQLLALLSKLVAAHEKTGRSAP